VPLTAIVFSADTGSQNEIKCSQNLSVSEVNKRWNVFLILIKKRENLCPEPHFRANDVQN
jgi:hypothetical protein